MKKIVLGIASIVLSLAILGGAYTTVYAHTIKIPVKHIIWVEKPEAELHTDRNDHVVSFMLEQVKKYTTFSYELTYDTNSGTEGVTGSGTLNKQNFYKSSPIVLGTCSSGSCVYDKHPRHFVLKITLTGPSGTVKLVAHH